MRSVDHAINVFKNNEVSFASLDHDLGYTGPLPGPCEDCCGTGIDLDEPVRKKRNSSRISRAKFDDPPCPSCDGDGFVGGDLLYVAAHAEKDGIELVKWMCETGTVPTEGVRIHSWNPAGASNMATMLRERFPELECVVREYSIELGE